MTQFRCFYAGITTLTLFGQAGKKSLHFDVNGLFVTDHSLFNLSLVKAFCYRRFLDQFREVVFGGILSAVFCIFSIKVVICSSSINRNSHSKAQSAGRSAT